MKKIMLLVAGFLTLTTAAMAGNDKPIRLNELPNAAQQFVSTHFGGRQVAYTTVDTERPKTYEVAFRSGEKIEFDRRGEWKEIKSLRGTLPPHVIPEAILRQIVRNYPGTRITSIERDRHEYEVGLTNGMELTFDKEFRLIDMDR
ncbi:MAG: PepSY-like domain-containing protein [Alistipes sp.]|nr:PepSY-like domain-containing protein [Alistipes sp.]MDE7069875.1 PepSY-like domain-containing protein [Alistipes sp.]